MGIFSFLNDMGNYEARKVGRDEVNGLTVSTAYSSDEGYETAVLDVDGVYPVERYDTEEEAEIGHKKWCKKAEHLVEVDMLGGLGGLVEGERVVLVRDGNKMHAQLKGKVDA